MASHLVIKRPLHTEKSVRDIREHNTYHFEVAPGATKHQVREAVEGAFPGTKVDSVRIVWHRGKSHRVRLRTTRTSDWKKAIVKIRPGDTIDIGY